MRAALLTVAMAAMLATGAAHASVTISAQPTSNMTCADGVCAPTAKKAVLNAADLANMLASGDVKITTGNGAVTITVAAPFSWTSSSRLTLDAQYNVSFKSPVIVAGQGAVTIITNDGGNGGDLIFYDKGNVTFWDLSSNLVINGNSYTLVSDIATLAADIANNPSGFYALANDYDAFVDGTYNSAPIATDFHGTFEGLGHAIANLKIVTSDFYVGLFRQVFGVLRDVGLPKVTIQGNLGAVEVGSLLGVSMQATIVGCYATGSIVTATTSSVGGLLGEGGQGGGIVRSYASVSVTVPDDSAAGGLVGNSGFDFIIRLSHANGRVKAGNNAWAGGLIGVGDGGIFESYATGNVLAGDNSYVGGLVGAVETIYNSYATGSVKGGTSAYIGGLGGETTGGQVEFNYSIGRVKGGNNGTSGGFVGINRSTMTGDYWDTNTSGIGKRRACGSGCPGRAVKGLTTAEFQSGLPEGFDPTIWTENPNINGGLPYLINNPPR